MISRSRVGSVGIVFGLAVAFVGRIFAQVPADEQIRPYDTIVYKSPTGTKETFVGKILDETFDAYNFRTRSGGNVKFPKKDVEGVVRRQTAEEVYRTKKKKLPRPTDDAEQRAQKNLELGLWCRTPHETLEGAPPASERAYEHLIKAVQLNPTLQAAYPHLLDVLAEERLQALENSGDTPVTENEVEVYVLAERGGFRHPEIDFRLGELYLGIDLMDRARKRFADVLTSEGPRNNSLLRRARQYLAQIHLRRGAEDDARALYESSAAGPDDFDRYYLGARLLMNLGETEDLDVARDYLAKASALQSDFPGVALQVAALQFASGKLRTAQSTLSGALAKAKDEPAFHSALGLVLVEFGRFKSAQQHFEAALELVGGAPRQEGDDLVELEARLGLGSIHATRGDLPAAIEHYRLALRAKPVDATASLLLARALKQTQSFDEAAMVLEEGLRRHAEDARVFGTHARELAGVELERGAEKNAFSLLTAAIDVQAKDGIEDVESHRSLGWLLLRRGEITAAIRNLEIVRKTAGASPELLCALAYCRYTNGEMEAAKELFEAVLKAVRAPSVRRGAEPQRVPKTRQYATQGLARIADFHGLEIKRDDFDRVDNDEILRGWFTDENFGVRVTLKDGGIVFSGKQANDADGVTKLFREEPADDVERISVRFRFDTESRVRAGLRFETTGDVAGIVLFRDFDGGVRFAMKTARSEWEDAKPTTGESRQGKLVYRGDVRWPDDGQFHTLTITRSAISKGRGFDLLVDDTVVAENVSIGAGKRKAAALVAVGVSGQSEALDRPYQFVVDDFHIYRKRRTTRARGKR